MMKKKFISLLFRSIQLCFILGLIVYGTNLFAQSDDDCFMCHEDESLTKVKKGKTISLYMDSKSLDHSVHKGVSCAGCHADLSDGDFPHAEILEKVDCGLCHEDANKEFYRGIHGQALASNAKHAPTCMECHGKTHHILPPSNPNSTTYKMNIPVLCGKCHREGAPVARAYNITEHNIVENYSQGIHGEGLFKNGLIVTATCNNCHGNHLVLPHTNPHSSISTNKIAETCMQCHARIEDVHTKVIRGELWEEKPGAIPACSACHPPHKENVQNIVANMADRSCLKCHGDENIHKTVDGEKVSLKVDRTEMDQHAHKNINCVKCHSDVSAHLDRPCETVGKVDCSSCHAEVSNNYFASGHGKAYFEKDENAPYCTDCHGSHVVISHEDDTSPVFRTEIPRLCGDCHEKDNMAIQEKGLKELDAYADYSTSVHGKGLEEKGLMVTAICTDCHTTHYMLPEDDLNSSVHPDNVPKTCATCHKPIYDEYMTSEHGRHSKTSEGKEHKYPTCVNCHSAHVISDIHQDKFMSEITQQCGSCHEHLAETYFETYHGKAYMLGYNEAARCSDCHGAHNILSVNNPNSMVGIHNIVNTCQSCHPDANERFTGYLTHATHNDKHKYPALYYAFWGMTLLLISVFSFFGLHTLLWLPRSLVERKRHKKPKVDGPQKYIRRFSMIQRITHLFVIVSFLLLVLTGMTLKFAYMDWAKVAATMLGGVKIAGLLHRFGAIITFGYFGFHVIYLFVMKYKYKTPWGKFIFGSESLMFNRQDLRDFWATMKWFVRKGPRPAYGRFTYWEKFDYMAVFWGVAVIGFSGLMLWFPEFFAKFLPGWAVNIAQIIHSDEALLAAGFIFTIHFFNTHFRPESFPMDTVIFTGHAPLDHYKMERPKEFEELEKAGKLEEKIITKEFTKWKMIVVKFFGFFFVAVGIGLVILIIYSLLS
jgi:predicted CXXCH cytochrome family protein